MSPEPYIEIIAIFSLRDGLKSCIARREKEARFISPLWFSLWVKGLVNLGFAKKRLQLFSFSRRKASQAFGLRVASRSNLPSKTKRRDKPTFLFLVRVKGLEPSPSCPD